MLGILSVAVGAVVSAVSTACSAIGGAIMSGIAKFSTVLLSLDAGKILGGIKTVISAVAELAIEKPAAELPEELGMRAEICHQEENLQPEDFASTEEYINHLRNEIHVDRTELEDLSDEDRLKYAIIGTGLYIQAMQSRFGGIELEPEFWRAVVLTNTVAKNVPVLVRNLSDGGIEHGKSFDSYLRGELPAGSDELRSTHQALKNYVQEIDQVSPEQAVGKVNEMIREYHRNEEQL